MSPNVPRLWEILFENVNGPIQRNLPIPMCIKFGRIFPFCNRVHSAERIPMVVLRTLCFFGTQLNHQILRVLH